MEQVQLKREAQLLIVKLCVQALLRAEQQKMNKSCSSQPLQKTAEKVP